MEGPSDGPGKGKKGCDGLVFVQPGEKDTQVQLVISATLGLTAFLAFCVSKTPTGPGQIPASMQRGTR